MEGGSETQLRESPPTPFSLLRPPWKSSVLEPCDALAERRCWRPQMLSNLGSSRIQRAFQMCYPGTVWFEMAVEWVSDQK